MIYDFDLARWGSAEGNPNWAIGENLGLEGIAVNPNRALMVIHNPKRPELTYLAMSVILAWEKNSVGCFDEKVIQRAFDLGLDMLVTNETERGLYGITNIFRRRYLNEEFRIVRVQPEIRSYKLF